MTEQDSGDKIVHEPHDDDPESLVGDPVEPDHDLDIESFDEEHDDEAEGEDA